MDRFSLRIDYRNALIETPHEVLKQAKQLESAPTDLPVGPFRVIVADPPWRYENGNDLPYPTMPIEDIKAMPVGDIADENAILWLWATNAHLRIAFDVVEAWGFEYKTLLTWVKDRMGTGEWLRGQSIACWLGAASLLFCMETTRRFSNAA